MIFLLLSLSFSARNDNRPLISKELVDRINSDPKSTYKAFLNPEFANLTISDVKRFLSPVRKDQANHGSARPVGANERYYPDVDSNFIVGLTLPQLNSHPDQIFAHTVYDNKLLCSSWASAVTSAMSVTLSIHSKKAINLSIQFILDCDIMGDPCIERPPLNAYEPFWRTKVPQIDRWDQPKKNGKDNLLRAPPSTINFDFCKDNCFIGWDNCPKNRVLSGECTPGSDDSNCPIYFLHNWKWIKSHLFEVGAVTSSILVYDSFFAYGNGVYSTINKNTDEIIGMLDVTIIGWGQVDTPSDQNPADRWWFVIPHFGKNFGENCETVYRAELTTKVNCPIGEKSGVMRISRKFDESMIESHAVGGVPFNFIPEPYRTPKPTWKGTV